MGKHSINPSRGRGSGELTGVLGRSRLYADALRNMRTRQLLTRVRRVIPPRLLAPPPKSPPRWTALAPRVGLGFSPQSGPQPGPSADRTFRAVGVIRKFDSEGFWTRADDGLLFLFSIHGFEGLAEFATAPDAVETRFWSEVIESWLGEAAEPVLPAWHPYPTSCRIVAWAAALSSEASWPEDLRAHMLASMWRQARYLRRSVEHDIGGNHVIRNAFALIAAGAGFGSDELVGQGRDILEREVTEQVLDDGGHFERSTSYHGVVAADLNDAALILRTIGRPSPSLEQAHRRMSAWTAAMAGPDGRLPMLNDSWEGPTPGARTTERITDLAASGYTVLREGADQMVFDAGPLAPPHLPPHAHADALSVVLWMGGEPILVDPGAFSYTGSERDAFRGTAAHNTVEVDAVDQCEFWGDFRLAHPPRVSRAPLRRQGELVILHGWHDGYRRLGEPVDHDRHVVWWPGFGLVVVDRLRGRGRHRVRSRLNLAPGLDPPSPFEIGELRLSPLGAAATPRLVTGAYAAYLGTKRPIRVVELGGVVSPDEPFGWSLLRNGARVESVSSAQVVLSGPGSEPISIELER